MKLGIATILLSASLAMAAEPTTRPIVLAPHTAALPRTNPVLIDPRRPAFVPKFAQVDNPPAGNFAERQYAYYFTYPTAGYGCYGGYGGWAFGGFNGSYGGGSWGSTTSFWR